MTVKLPESAAVEEGGYRVDGGGGSGSVARIEPIVVPLDSDLTNRGTSELVKHLFQKRILRSLYVYFHDIDAGVTQVPHDIPQRFHRESEGLAIVVLELAIFFSLG
jgi:hypothetical protein